MSLDQLRSSSLTRRVSIVPERFLMMTLAILCANCGKPEAPTQSTPERAPTGAIVETLTDTTFATRHALAQEVSEEALGTTGGGSYTRRFPLDPEHPTDWHLQQLDVEPGPEGSIYIVTVKEEGVKMHVKKIMDDDGDGRVDEFTSSTNWPIETNTGTPTMHSELRSQVVGNRAYDDFASALLQARRILAAEREAQEVE